MATAQKATTAPKKGGQSPAAVRRVSRVRRHARLRKKIEVDPAHPDSIRTVRGVGYMFVPPKD